MDRSSAAQVITDAAMNFPAFTWLSLTFLFTAEKLF